MKKKTKNSKIVPAITENIEEYLESIYRLSLKNPGGWVKNKEISERLHVKAPSVTNMLEKLTQIDLIEWAPRHGIKLTEKGREKAKNLVTGHILSELFIERVLKIVDPELINKMACDMEHHINSDTIIAMKNLLGLENIQNTENFILDDLPPSHIETKKVLTGNDILSLLENIRKDLLSEITIPDSHPIINAVINRYRRLLLNQEEDSDDE